MITNGMLLQMSTQEAQHACEGRLGSVVDGLLPDISPHHPPVLHVTVFTIDTFFSETHNPNNIYNLLKFLKNDKFLNSLAKVSMTI